MLNGLFALRFNALRAGKAGELRLVAAHVNGLTDAARRPRL